MAKSDVYRAPIGTKDIIGQESRNWQSLIALFAKRAHLYNYDLAITPTFENYEVFSRLGEDTDVVSKEMYDFYDKGERHIALRPEGTAGVVRAFSELRPVTPFKAWYLNSHFRYERPQKGRLREHHQFGIEAIGIEDPSIDVEVIQFANEFLKDCGLKNLSLSINSLGDSQARSQHMEALTKYFAQYEEKFGEEFTNRVRKNPFRMLDTKVEEWLEVAANAPSIHDFLSQESKDSFEYVKTSLDALGIKYEVVPKLVRGLDYYTNTTFEFISNSLDAAQSTVCGGGRYNKLVAEMGGPETPGIGFGLGVERLLLALEAEDIELSTRKLDVYAIDLVHNEQSQSALLDLTSKLRNAGISVDISYGSKSMKSSMKGADRSGAKYSAIIGEDELAKNQFTLKNMETGEQSLVTIDGIIEEVL